MSVMHVDVQCLCDDVVLCSFLLCENSEEGETKKEGENNFKILQFQFEIINTGSLSLSL
jgi:hypothetical protein